jgi:flagellar biosynthesis/type III secretory pathway protein FliH
LSLERLVLGSVQAPRDVRLLDLHDGSAIEALLERVRERALAEGRAQGREEARARGMALLEAAEQRLDEARQAACADLARSAVQLAVEIARQLVRVEVDAGRHDLERIVRVALETSSAGRSQVVVHLNPADIELLRNVSFRAGTRLQADIGVARGDVQVETSLGILVREIDGLLESIGDHLLEDAA